MHSQKMALSDSEARGSFGFSVAVHGDRAVVGAVWDEDRMGSAEDTSSASRTTGRGRRPVRLERGRLRGNRMAVGIIRRRTSPGRAAWVRPGWVAAEGTVQRRGKEGGTASALASKETRGDEEGEQVSQSSPEGTKSPVFEMRFRQSALCAGAGRWNNSRGRSDGGNVSPFVCCSGLHDLLEESFETVAPPLKFTSASAMNPCL